MKQYTPVFGIMLGGAYLTKECRWMGDNAHHNLMTWDNWDAAHDWLDSQIVKGVIGEAACVCQVYPDEIRLVDTCL